MGNPILTRNRVNVATLQAEHRAKEAQRNPEDEQRNQQEQTEYEKMKEEVRHWLQEEHPGLIGEASFSPRKKDEFERVVKNYIQVNRKFVQGYGPEDLSTKIWKDLCSLDVLDDVMNDDSITDIMFNGWDESWIKRTGERKMKRVPDLIKFESKKHYETVLVTKILNSCGKAASTTDPIVDARVGDARVALQWQPISQMKGPITTIRKFPPIELTPEQFLEKKTASKEMLDFMELLTIAEAVIVMGGKMGSGKTTTFKMMAGFTKQRTHVIEDPAEMRLEILYPPTLGYHFVSSEVRIQNRPDDITIQKIMEAAMRHNVERFIIGEIRRAPDLLTTIETATTGHPVWWTSHGRSAFHMFQRHALQLRRADPSLGLKGAVELLADTLDIIMMQKIYKDGIRRISEMVEVAGIDEKGKEILNPIFVYDTETKKFVRKNPISDKLRSIFENAEIPYEKYEPYLRPVEQAREAV